jgi:hypothetical protein
MANNVHAMKSCRANIGIRVNTRLIKTYIIYIIKDFTNVFFK